MSRDLLPDQFHVRTRNCMDKNRAIVKMLTEFGIGVHNSENSRTESIDTYNDCFDPHMSIIVRGNESSGGDSGGLSRVSIGELLEAYGKLA